MLVKCTIKLYSKVSYWVAQYRTDELTSKVHTMLVGT